MKRLFIYKILTINLLLYSIIVPGIGAALQPDSTGRNPWKVVIDAGHGGQDPGALGKKSKEKDIVLQIALKLGKLISENCDDVEVVYTRNTDVFIPLDQRAEIANKHHANLFISIHANSNPKNTADGTETYVMGLHTSEANMEVARKENAVITFEKNYKSKYEGYDPNSSESFIIFNLIQNTHLEQSLDFASKIQEQFKTKAKRPDRGVKQAGFLVLWKTTMPSVLVETGFISNATEEQYLLSESGKDYLASSIYRAFKSYKNAIESRSNFVFNGKKDTNSRQNPTKRHVPDSILADTTAIIKTHVADTILNRATDNLFFTVQFAASNKRIPTNAREFKRVKEVNELQIGRIYKYTSGNFANYQNAIDHCKEIKAIFPDAFILAVKNGKIISIKDALKELNN
jgi:N-acetylmuramoyl-L-alanine amidase